MIEYELFILIFVIYMFAKGGLSLVTGILTVFAGKTTETTEGVVRAIYGLALIFAGVVFSCLG